LVAKLEESAKEITQAKRQTRLVMSVTEFVRKHLKQRLEARERELQLEILAANEDLIKFKEQTAREMEQMVTMQEYELKISQVDACSA